MIGKIHVIGPDEIEERPWVKISGDNAAGERLYMKWCIACHTLDGNKLVGPSFKGMFGREEEMKDGEKITVDEAYVIESIKEPSAKIVKGFETQPMLKLPLDDAEIASLVEFLKSEELK
jgi:cytochrome c oxidase subunit 2